MRLMKVDPRALKENPDRSRQTKSTPQADALLLATIKAVGIVQPPVVAPQTDGGNGFIIDRGHRRVKQAIAAGLEEIEVLVDEAANDNGAMRSMVENIAREQLKGVEMIGDLRTDALHEALARAPIKDSTLTALLVLALAGRNISVQSGASSDVYGYARMERHAVRLVGEKGELAFDMDTLRSAARSALIDALSARENRTDSGIVARIAGEAIGSDNFLPNMATDDFLSCLSRVALERSCKDTSVLPRQKVKDTRAALVEHFKEERFVHPAALFAPDEAKLAQWLSKSADVEGDDEAADPSDPLADGDELDADDEAYQVAAE